MRHSAEYEAVGGVGGPAAWLELGLVGILVSAGMVFEEEECLESSEAIS